MNKEATDLLRLALQSVLTGSGAYAGLRLAHNMAEKASPPEKPKHELELSLPKDRLKSAETSSVSDYVLPAIVGAGGAGAGFFGASKLYSHFKKKQLDKDTTEAEKGYMHTLQQAHQKTAEKATPYVDKFLMGMIAKVGELAAKEGSNVNFPTEGLLDNAGHGVWNAIRGAADTGVGHAAQAAALLTALTTGAGVYYIHDQMDRQKEQNKRNSTLPNDIKLNIG